jgi:hypothetical protein
MTCTSASSGVECSGPFSWLVLDPATASFEAAACGAAGIDLWTVDPQDSPFIDDIGDTETTFGPRLRQHWCQPLAGMSQIDDPERFVVGQQHALWWAMYKGDREPVLALPHRQVRALQTSLRNGLVRASP